MSFEFFDGATQAGSLLASDLRPDASGRFEVLLGPKEQAGHWLEVVPGTSYLLTREFFTDWGAAEPSVMRIECLDDPASGWPVMSADRVAKELEALGTWLVETVRIFSGAQAKGIRQFANQWDPHVSRPDNDLPAIHHAYWDLRARPVPALRDPGAAGRVLGHPARQQPVEHAGLRQQADQPEPRAGAR